VPVLPGVAAHSAPPKILGWGWPVPSFAVTAAVAVATLSVIKVVVNQNVLTCLMPPMSRVSATPTTLG
jgi:hypothetical protein